MSQENFYLKDRQSPSYNISQRNMVVDLLTLEGSLAIQNNQKTKYNKSKLI